MTHKIHWMLVASVAASALAACTDATNSPGAASPAEAQPSTAAAAPAATTTPTADTPAAPAATASADATNPGTAKTAAAAPAAGNGAIDGDVVVTPAKLGKHVVVYLANAPASTDPPKPATIDQRSMRFLPYMTVLPVGGKVVFRNSDPFPHNIFSPEGHFNLGTMPPHAARVHVFKKAGSYTLLCNIHPGMIGYVDVVPSTYFAKVGKDGKFEIKNVPNGTYQVKAWGPKLAVGTQSVTVSGATANVEFHLHRGG